MRKFPLTVGVIALLGAIGLANAQPADQSVTQAQRPGTGPGTQGLTPRGPMGPGTMGPGAMGPGVMGPGAMGPGARAMPHGPGGMGPGGMPGGMGMGAAPPGAPSMMMGGDMMRMMAMMEAMRGDRAAMGMGIGMGTHIEGQIAFFRAELGITEAQSPRWNAFADVMRAQAAALREAMRQPPPAAATAPERIEQRIARLTARTDAMKAVLEGLKPLYAELSDEQKKSADTLMEEHFMAMRRGPR